MEKTPETFELIGLALYGPNWLGPLGKALTINDRTMRRMADGSDTIPSGVWNDLAQLCRQRAEELIVLANRLGGNALGPSQVGQPKPGRRRGPRGQNYL